MSVICPTLILKNGCKNVAYYCSVRVNLLLLCNFSSYRKKIAKSGFFGVDGIDFDRIFCQRSDRSSDREIYFFERSGSERKMKKT